MMFKTRINEKCNACGFDAVKLNGGICLHCRFFDTVKAEKRILEEAISFFQENYMCAYCGDPSEEIEHVFPVCSGLPTFTVPACRECNSMASGSLFDSFDDKFYEIKKRRAKKYKKVLCMPEWSAEELMELSGKMRLYVESCESMRKHIKKLIDFDWVLYVNGQVCSE